MEEVKNTKIKARISISVMAMIGNRVLSRLLPVRPRVTHPPVGPCRCGRAGTSASPPILYLMYLPIAGKKMLPKKNFNFFDDIDQKDERDEISGFDFPI